ncbi:MAG: phosphopantothenoylcysteine decarboxylase [Planctomycetota bacterium]
MQFSRPIWITAGAPRVPVDGVRYLTAAATGATAAELAGILRARRDLALSGLNCLCSQDALACHAAHRDHPTLFDRFETFTTYAELAAQLQSALQADTRAAVIMSAAVNDYEVARVEAPAAGLSIDPAIHPGAKLPSGLTDVAIRLKPTAKIIERIRREWAPDAYLVGFKNEPADTVVAAARKLLERADCHLVVANSIGLDYNAIVRKNGALEPYPARRTMLDALARLLLHEDGM